MRPLVQIEPRVSRCRLVYITVRQLHITPHRSRVAFLFPPLTVSPFPQALQEKVESLQRQLHCSEKKLLSKELETEEKVIHSCFFFPLPSHLFFMLVRQTCLSLKLICPSPLLLHHSHYPTLIFFFKTRSGFSSHFLFASCQYITSV